MVSDRLRFLHFHPERIAWIGSTLLGIGFGLALFVLSALEPDEPATLIRKEPRSTSLSLLPCSFSFNTNSSSIDFPLPDLKGKMAFSFDPPRPNSVNADQPPICGILRIKQTSQSKRVILPCRLGLAFQKDRLQFVDNTSSFWVELAPTNQGQIEAKVGILGADQSILNTAIFYIKGEDCPIQAAQDFAEGSAFRALAEAKWWGRDLFKSQEGSAERIEFDELLQIREGDWLVWKEEKWQKGDPEINLPIAKIQSVCPKVLVLEGWNLNEHTRIALNLAQPSPLRTRGEDLLSMVRIRSEKQISCMLEKQCLVLKRGDWVLKTANRWKILRKKEERDAFLNEKISGELFIFEQITQRQGQKVIQGRLFNPGRTQVTNLEITAQMPRKLRASK